MKSNLIAPESASYTFTSGPPFTSAPTATNTGATAAEFVSVTDEPPTSCTSVLTWKLPPAVNVLAPDTRNTPPPSAVTVPAVMWPSPQSMVAWKSVTGAFGFWSVNVATGPLNG